MNELQPYEGDYFDVEFAGDGPFVSQRVLVADDGRIYLHPAPLLGAVDSIAPFARLRLRSRCYFQRPLGSYYYTPDEIGEWWIRSRVQTNLGREQLRSLLDAVGDRGILIMGPGQYSGQFIVTRVAPSRQIWIGEERLTREEWESRRARAGV